MFYSALLVLFMLCLSLVVHFEPKSPQWFLGLLLSFVAGMLYYAVVIAMTKKLLRESNLKQEEVLKKAFEHTWIELKTIRRKLGA